MNDMLQPFQVAYQLIETVQNCLQKGVKVNFLLISRKTKIASIVIVPFKNFESEYNRL